MYVICLHISNDWWWVMVTGGKKRSNTAVHCSPSWWRIRRSKFEIPWIKLFSWKGIIRSFFSEKGRWVKPSAWRHRRAFQKASLPAPITPWVTSCFKNLPLQVSPQESLELKSFYPVDASDLQRFVKVFKAKAEKLDLFFSNCFFSVQSGVIRFVVALLSFGGNMTDMNHHIWISKEIFM